MVSYGDTQYTWDYGKSLSSIQGDGKSYYYKYDENGIRTSKAVNGKTTRFNTLGGTVLAQSDSSGVMYFQYDNAGAPIGFVYNDVQYLYITNISGDIAGITDAQGNLLAEYTYDAWGRLLDITTAEEGNEEQLSLANANPLRYRGYYYDNETGYYYLQSRYYNPEWGRFISADDFDYIGVSVITDLNTYVYCNNSPIISSDPEGTDDGPKLGYQDWTYRREYNQKNSRGTEHMHLDSKQNGKHYAQNDDGSPHDKSKNSPGSPPGKVKKKLKAKTGWDWDAKAKQYEDKQKENSETFSLELNLNLSYVSDLIVAVILIVLCVPTGVALGFLIFAALFRIPVFV